MQLSINVFNEKIVTVLEMNDHKDTSIFVNLISRLFHILNVIQVIYIFSNISEQNIMIAHYLLQYQKWTIINKWLCQRILFKQKDSLEKNIIYSLT